MNQPRAIHSTTKPTTYKSHLSTPVLQHCLDHHLSLLSPTSQNLQTYCDRHFLILVCIINSTINSHMQDYGDHQGCSSLVVSTAHIIMININCRYLGSVTKLPHTGIPYSGKFSHGANFRRLINLERNHHAVLQAIGELHGCGLVAGLFRQIYENLHQRKFPIIW